MPRSRPAIRAWLPPAASGTPRTGRLRIWASASRSAVAFPMAAKVTVGDCCFTLLAGLGEFELHVRPVRNADASPSNLLAAWKASRSRAIAGCLAISTWATCNRSSGKVFAQRFRQGVFRLRLDCVTVTAVRLSSFASSFLCSGFTSPLSRKGVPSWPMETKQPASGLCPRQNRRIRRVSAPPRPGGHGWPAAGPAGCPTRSPQGLAR